MPGFWPRRCLIFCPQGFPDYFALVGLSSEAALGCRKFSSWVRHNSLVERYQQVRVVGFCNTSGVTTPLLPVTNRFFNPVSDWRGSLRTLSSPHVCVKGATPNCTPVRLFRHSTNARGRTLPGCRLPIWASMAACSGWYVGFRNVRVHRQLLLNQFIFPAGIGIPTPCPTVAAQMGKKKPTQKGFVGFEKVSPHVAAALGHCLAKAASRHTRQKTSSGFTEIRGRELACFQSLKFGVSEAVIRCCRADGQRGEPARGGGPGAVPGQGGDRSVAAGRLRHPRARHGAGGGGWFRRESLMVHTDRSLRRPETESSDAQ